MPKTVKQLKEELSLFPEKAFVYAYEGERTGISVKHKGQSGFIECKQYPQHDQELILLH